MRNIVFPLLISSFAHAQLGSASLPQAQVNEVLAEALHQAVSLEKLPDATFLLQGDTIFVEAFQFRDLNDTTGERLGRDQVPFHVDRWRIVLTTSADLVARPRMHYLVVKLVRKDDDWIVDLICQPNSEDFIDRGRLWLSFSFSNGVPILTKLVRWYG